MTKNLMITDAKGFHLKCANGVSVSVQFGYGNYADNYNNVDMRPPHHEVDVESNTAEVAVWFADGSWHIWPDHDEVQGYIPADEVARLIGYCQSWQQGTPFDFAWKPEVTRG